MAQHQKQEQRQLQQRSYRAFGQHKLHQQQLVLLFWTICSLFSLLLMMGSRGGVSAAGISFDGNGNELTQVQQQQLSNAAGKEDGHNNNYLMVNIKII